MRRPRFRLDYTPVPLPDGHLVVIGEHRSLLIDDPAASALATALDGTRPLAEIITDLAPAHSMAALASALGRLRDHGLLTSGAVSTHPAVAAGWDARMVDPDTAERVAGREPLLLVDAGTPAADALSDALTALAHPLYRCAIDDPDIATAISTTRGHLVVAPESMIDTRLGRINQICIDQRRSWTLVRPHGQVVLVGPHLVPDRTGCWLCLRLRWQPNEQVENFLAGRFPEQPRVVAARAALPATAFTAAGLLAAELPVLAQHGVSPRLTGRMMALDTVQFTADSHHLVRLPHCPACGDPDLLAKSDPRIPLTSSSPVGRRTERGLDRMRDVPVPELLAVLDKHVSRYLGVVTRLTPLAEPGQGPFHTYLAGHNFAQPTQPLSLRRSLRGNSGGKGTTDPQARVSAIGEAIERYCGVWRDDRPVHRASYRDLGPERAVHLRDLLLFSPHQYAGRDRLNATSSHLHRIPRPLADDQELDWTTGWSLTRDRAREVPAAYCWYGHPELAGLQVCSADSNGCAAGANRLEAILHGFCELVERDSVAIWWYHRSRLPGVDLDSFDDPWIDSLRTYYADEHRRELWVLDLTADLAVPTFAAVSRLVDGDPEDVLVGFGAHLDPHAALTRALTEMNQFLPAAFAGVSNGTRYGVDDPDTLRWFTTVRVAEQPWLLPDPAQQPTRAGDRHPTSSGDQTQDVRRCVDLAAEAGLEVIVVDQSRPDLELAVVKVIVPGLRHFWRRLGAGRLWQVPQTLGRAPRALDEPGINPLNVFF
ncbi:TOMM precursor leader peptide-binding protein [Solwaraspora sp. WMMD937]|uniref:TOMM precursor leader peptide-binding protein n=1 Tax=Solwaraspora sp. WMMD937 TaxID=3016090 RepID=UPI00249B4A9D|nr:TOMM precursor leader peptide-binding protein [Solwaraspora sp. WMMD937]WFE22204.1 TOMM precursor leader peptide-binding protein [Solwaraspora sp. WMMD937]